jgi:hypothetical protein
VWDVDADAMRSIDGFAGAVTAVAWSPDNRSLVAGGKDGSVRRFPDDLPRDGTGLRQSLPAAAVSAKDAVRGADPRSRAPADKQQELDMPAPGH